ncbi:MAG: hypothetical protein ACTSU5_12445 [Promethearchaeota archaeon]
MSYIPKYIMKRLVPPDAMKKVEGGVELTLINVIQPIPADQIPGDPLDFLEVKVNGETLTRDELEQIKVMWEDNEYMLGSIADAGTIPIGATIKFFFPTDKVAKGDEATVEVIIAELGMNLKIERTVN